MIRRFFLVGIATMALVAVIASPAGAAEPVKEVRIGYQKIGALLVTKARKVLEQRFEPRGITVKWVDFQAGPPLLEALNAGAIDYGYTGDSPPIFAQAAKARILYVAAIPARGEGQGIVVNGASPIKTLADLKGKKVGVAKGSSGHNLLIAALENVNIGFNEITPVYLAPADAAAALASGAIDAWSIWDPFYAIAEVSKNARALPINRKATEQNSFFLANRDFVAKYPDIVIAINEEVSKATQWADQHRDETAHLFAEASGVDYAAQKRSVDRSEFTYGPLTDHILAVQQSVADRYYALKLIPNRIDVRDIVWEKAKS
jgi:aliphatic sulfonates family ABC transporter substrate-binding protein